MSIIRLDHDAFSGVYTLYLRDQEVGYISKIKYEHDGRKGFRGVSVHGDVIYAYSLLSAQNLLMGAYH
jgi:hypothetical protein